jgi:hypothetical protein
MIPCCRYASGVHGNAPRSLKSCVTLLPYDQELNGLSRSLSRCILGRHVAGTSADNAAADSPAERAEGEAAPSANESAGRGLGCNTAELLAICSSGLTVDRDSVRGADMKKAERAQATSRF